MNDKNTIVTINLEKPQSILHPENEVNFSLLTRLVSEGEYDIAGTIEFLAMDDIAMSSAVIDLGIAIGVLLPGYKNGWSEEYDKEA